MYSRLRTVTRQGSLLWTLQQLSTSRPQLFKLQMHSIRPTKPCYTLPVLRPRSSVLSGRRAAGCTSCSGAPARHSAADTAALFSHQLHTSKPSFTPQPKNYTPANPALRHSLKTTHQQTQLYATAQKLHTSKPCFTPQPQNYTPANPALRHRPETQQTSCCAIDRSRQRPPPLQQLPTFAACHRPADTYKRTNRNCSKLFSSYLRCILVLLSCLVTAQPEPVPAAQVHKHATLLFTLSHYSATKCTPTNILLRPTCAASSFFCPVWSPRSWLYTLLRCTSTSQCFQACSNHYSAATTDQP
jgi:hypothetical protein